MGGNAELSVVIFVIAILIAEAIGQPCGRRGESRGLKCSLKEMARPSFLLALRQQLEQRIARRHQPVRPRFLVVQDRFG